MNVTARRWVALVVVMDVCAVVLLVMHDGLALGAFALAAVAAMNAYHAIGE